MSNDEQAPRRSHTPISRSLDLTAVESRGKLDIAEFELQHFDYRYMVKGDEQEDKWNGWLKPSCIPITIILILIVLVVILPLLDDKGDQKKGGSPDGTKQIWNNCTDKCVLIVLETLPSDLNYSSSVQHASTIGGWLDLLRNSERTLDIVTASWDVPSSLLDKEVETLYRELVAAVNERGIRVRIVRNHPFTSSPRPYGDEFLDSENVQTQNINLRKLQGAGLVPGTQIWIVDNTHLYIGSSALDWMMVNQMKDIGIAMYNCSCVAEDLQKIFQLYWMLTGTDSSIPKDWPITLETTISKEVPLNMEINDTYTQLYISNSPEILCPEGRSSNIDSILDIISKAKRYIHISVMDYMPTTCHNQNLRYWSILDGALRQAAIDRRVSIKILVSDWNETPPSMFYFLKSLLALNSTLIHIDVKLFIMPIVSKRPYPSSPRVNRNSFMITEKTLYISTFGWSGDNFLNMAGVGLVIDQSQNGTTNYQPIKQQFQSVFDRDWTSPYAHTLSEVG